MGHCTLPSLGLARSAPGPLTSLNNDAWTKGRTCKGVTLHSYSGGAPMPAQWSIAVQQSSPWSSYQVSRYACNRSLRGLHPRQLGLRRGYRLCLMPFFTIARHRLDYCGDGFPYYMQDMPAARQAMLWGLHHMSIPSCESDALHVLCSVLYSPILGWRVFGVPFRWSTVFRRDLLRITYSDAPVFCWAP